MLAQQKYYLNMKRPKISLCFFQRGVRSGDAHAEHSKKL